MAGLRPFRPSGFRLETQQIGGKIVVHNYGHGGGGVTLSWGTAELAVEEVQRAGQKQYAVLGSGAVGLATARLLQQRGGRVAIYAKDLPPHTTSNIAGALFRPGTGFDPERVAPAFFDRFERAMHLSHRHFEAMIGDRYGIRRVFNYFLGDEPLVDAEILVDARVSGRIRDLYPLAAELAQDQHPFPARFVNRHQNLLIEPPIYLPAMLEDFQRAGGTVTVHAFESIDAVLALPEPVIMNCTGLGAKALFNDEELTPVKGQLTVLAPQPEVDYVAYRHDLYMIPRRDGILLGGTFERGNWSLEPDQGEKRRILEGHRKIFSQFRS